MISRFSCQKTEDENENEVEKKAGFRPSDF